MNNFPLRIPLHEDLTTTLKLSIYAHNLRVDPATNSTLSVIFIINNSGTGFRTALIIFPSSLKMLFVHYSSKLSTGFAFPLDFFF